MIAFGFKDLGNFEIFKFYARYSNNFSSAFDLYIFVHFVRCSLNIDWILMRFTTINNYVDFLIRIRYNPETIECPAI